MKTLLSLLSRSRIKTRILAGCRLVFSLSPSEGEKAGVRWLPGFTLLALLLLLSSGCQHVSPWERSALADPTMNADRDPPGAMADEHVWFSREQASGGRGVGGGGCGCN